MSLLHTNAVDSGMDVWLIESPQLVRRLITSLQPASRPGLVGKGGHIRTVPVPTWVKATIDTWTTAAGITHGAVFRAINKTGRIWGDGMTPKVLWDVVRAAAARPV